MRDLAGFGMCVLALMLLPALGCSDSAGSGGSGGSAGAGGAAGTAGSAGGGGDGGSGGGTVAPESGVWMGEGAGGSAGWTACFVVNEAGTALSANGTDCQSFAIQVGVTDCGSLWRRPDIPIEDGSFEYTDGTNTITGMFDSATMASGTFTESDAGCSGEWTATPAMQ